MSSILSFAGKKNIKKQIEFVSEQLPLELWLHNASDFISHLFSILQLA